MVVYAPPNPCPNGYAPGIPYAPQSVYLPVSPCAPASVLPGFTSRYDASQLSLADGVALTSWADLGSNNNALVLGTAANYYKTTSSFLINGHSAVRFSPAGPSFLTGPLSASQPFSFFVVWEPLSAANSNTSFIIHMGGSFAGLYYMLTPTNMTQLYFGANVNTGLTVAVGQAAAIGAVINGASTIVTVNGVSSGALSPGAGGITDIAMGQPNAGNAMDSLYGELLYYPFALTPAQLNTLHSYAAAKWGTP